MEEDDTKYAVDLRIVCGKKQATQNGALPEPKLLASNRKMDYLVETQEHVSETDGDQIARPNVLS